jgi:hypothetical protein
LLKCDPFRPLFSKFETLLQCACSYGNLLCELNIQHRPSLQNMNSRRWARQVHVDFLQFTKCDSARLAHLCFTKYFAIRLCKIAMKDPTLVPLHSIYTHAYVSFDVLFVFFCVWISEATIARWHWTDYWYFQNFSWEFCERNLSTS